MVKSEFGLVGRKNIWLSIIKQAPSCVRSVGLDPEPNIFPSGPTTQSMSTQYFGFVRHTFITNDVIEHEK